jgi:SAM-dependent methyltransferase
MARYYNEVAQGWYTRTINKGESSRFSEAWDAILKLLHPYVDPPISILDIGTGPGFPAAPMLGVYSWKTRIEERIPQNPLEAYYEWIPTEKIVVAIDISPNMLKVTRWGTTLENVIIMDGRHLGFHADFFDLVTCIGTFEYVDNLKPFLEEAKRVLVPNGLYLFNFFNQNYIEARNGGQYPRAVHNPFRVFRLMDDVGVPLVEFTTLREQREVLCLARNKSLSV